MRNKHMLRTVQIKYTYLGLIQGYYYSSFFFLNFENT